MKKLLSILSLFVAMTFAANARPEIQGLFRDKINVVLDYTDVRIMNMTEEELSNFDDSWEKSKPTFFKNFCYGINPQTHTRFNDEPSLSFGNYPDASFTLKVNIATIDGNGKTSAHVWLYNKDGEAVWSNEWVTCSLGTILETNVPITREYSEKVQVSICNNFMWGIFSLGCDIGVMIFRDAKETKKKK